MRLKSFSALLIGVISISACKTRTDSSGLADEASDNAIAQILGICKDPLERSVEEKDATTTLFLASQAVGQPGDLRGVAKLVLESAETPEDIISVFKARYMEAYQNNDINWAEVDRALENVQNVQKVVGIFTRVIAQTNPEGASQFLIGYFDYVNSASQLSENDFFLLLGALDQQNLTSNPADALKMASIGYALYARFGNSCGSEVCGRAKDTLSRLLDQAGTNVADPGEIQAFAAAAAVYAAKTSDRLPLQKAQTMMAANNLGTNVQLIVALAQAKAYADANNAQGVQQALQAAQGVQGVQADWNALNQALQGGNIAASFGSAMQGFSISLNGQQVAPAAMNVFASPALATAARPGAR